MHCDDKGEWTFDFDHLEKSLNENSKIVLSIRLDENVRQQRVQKTFRQEHVKLVFQMFGNWTFWR